MVSVYGESVIARSRSLGVKTSGSSTPRDQQPKRKSTAIRASMDKLKEKYKHQLQSQLNSFRKVAGKDIKRDKKTAPWSVPAQLCVMLNNIEAARQKLDALEGDIEARVDEKDRQRVETVFAATFTTLKTTLTELMEDVVTWVRVHC